MQLPSSYLGDAVDQTSKGNRVIDVMDKGSPVDTANRGYSSRSMLPFHTDGADLVGLPFLETALQGMGLKIVVTRLELSAPKLRRLASRSQDGRMACRILLYQWALRGSRPPAVRDNRHDQAYIFGAICPARAVGAAIVTPWVNSEAMSIHLAEIAKQVCHGSHAVAALLT